ncbi:hypothetical protein V8D89_009122 [Ganoderma adspersum]
MAQEYYADTQNLNQFPDEWDVVPHGYRDVDPAPEYQSPGGYYDAGALAAYSNAAAEPPLGYYDPGPDASAEVAFDHYDVGGAHPSSAFGFLHYLPPAAISKKYYALQDPNVYPADNPNPSSYSPSTATTAFDSAPSPSTTDSYLDGALIVTSSPVPKLEEQPPTVFFTPAPPSPLTTGTDSSSSVLTTPTLTPTPLTSPTYNQDFGFQPTQSWHPTPSGPPECAHPVLPKQRRNRDDPGGDAGRLAQVTVQTGAGVPYHAAPGAAQDLQDAYYHGTTAVQVQEQPVVVPSQWKVGAVLDRLRFPRYAYGGDWDALMVALYGEGYQACMPRLDSPLSAEDITQLEQLSRGFGLSLPSAPTQPTTPMTPITPATPVMAADDEDAKIVIYSPMTGQRIPVTAGPNGPVLQLSAVPPSARRPYKRGAVAACAFCRRRKIACGGPKEGDEAGRCGQCIQRQQPCEFPGTASYQHAHAVPLSAPPSPYGYAPPAHGTGDAPRYHCS